MAGEEALTPEQRRLEALYLGMRTREGVALELVPVARGKPWCLRRLSGRVWRR